MKNFTKKILNSIKICLLLLGFMFSGNALFAQKVIIIGVNYSNNATRNDAVSFVVNIPLVSGESIFFTDNEYNAAANNFSGNLGGGTSTESILQFTTNTNIAKGQVISLRFSTPFNTGDATPVTVACTGGVCGTASFLNNATVLPSFRQQGESIYAYSDSDTDPLNGVTEIFSVFYPSAETGTNSTGGNIPSTESPLTDFPNAIVVDGFTFASGTTELHLLEFTASRTNVSKTIIETESNYTSSNNPASNPNTTAFTNLNLLGTNPSLTLLASTASIVENAAGTITFTFTLSANAASNITVNFNVTGTATFGTDYTQSGAASFTTTAGTITIPSGSNTASFTIDPTGDGTLEANETVTITAISDVGYDAGSPSVATVTITNDDTDPVQPKVAISGLNHGAAASDVESFSFAALEDIAAGTKIYFTDNSYDKLLLKFNNDSKAVYEWTAPATVNRGDVFVVSEVTNGGTTFSLTCSDGSGCGTLAVTQGSGMTFAPTGTTFMAFSDGNTDPFAGTTPIVGQIHSVLYTGTSTTPGGAMLSGNNPSSIYPNVVISENFPAVNPVRTEYKFASGERAVTVNRALFTNPSNWLHAATTQTVSTVRFTNIIITNGVALPLVTVNVSPSSVAENSGTGMVYTFTLSQNAASNMTINFAVTGTATFSTDYTQTGAASFTATTGSVVIPSGSNSATVTITPVADAGLEPNETVILTIDTGTGYDAGSPSNATATITNDDVSNINPKVVIVGINHGNTTNQDPDGFSFAANQNLAGNSKIYFTENLFNNTTLGFSGTEAVLEYTVPPAGLVKGQVVYIVETGPSTNAYTITCSAASSPNCGSVTSTGDFSFFSGGENFYAYSDNNNNPNDGITEIHSLFYTLNNSIPPTENPTTVFPNAVVITGFGSASPDRTEYKFAAGERSSPINLANIQTTSNYLIGQTTQALSVIPFAALNLCPASITTNPSNPAAFCEGGNTSFTVGVTGSNLTYQWQVNTGSGFTDISNGGIYSGATSPTLTLTNVPFANNGFTYQCVVNACATSTAATLTVNANPTATPSSNTPVCVGNTLNLTSTVATSYLWTGPNSFSGTTQNPSISNVTIVAGGTYTLRVTNASGCTGTATTSVTINALPAATASSSTPTICVGNTISLTGGGVGTYLWSGPNTYTSTAQSPTIANATVLASGVYTIRVTNANNCTSTATTSVTVNAGPTATASSNSPVCAGATINLTGGASGNTYLWTGPNSFTSTDQSPSIANATTAATGTYTIRVSDGSCTSTATTSVTVNPLPTATASSNSPVCIGNNLNLMGGGVGTYAWAGPNSFTSTAQSPTIANATALATGTYTITVTNANNCTSTATTAVTMNAVPTATASNSTPTICEGSSISLIGGGGGTYLWSGPNGYTSTAQSPTILNATIVASGTYTVTVTGAGNCTSTATTSVTVNNVPFASANSNSPICAGATLNLNSGSEGNTYLWTGPNSFTSTELSPSIANASVLATGTYTITITNTSSCTSTATVAVTVNAVPTATASSNSPVCVGNSISLTGGGVGTYLWTGPNGYSSTAQSPTIANATVSASGTYTITVTGGASCISTATTAVTVNANPAATASTNTPVICAGNNIALTGGGVGTYAWAGPNGYSSTAQSPTISNATVSATGTYTITVTNVSGCTSTATVAVTVNALPTATASTNTPVICAGNNIALTGGGVGTYAWAGPNGYSSTAQSPTISNAMVSATGTYTITVTNVSGCTSTATVAVTVNALPTATASTSTPVICAGNNIALTGGGIGTYAWAGPNGYSSTAQSPTISNATVSATGTYTITVTNVSGCTSTATVAVTVNATPIATASTNTPVICAGNNIALTGGGIGTYAWAGPNGYSSTAQSPTISNATVSASGTYTITVTNVNNCTSTATVAVTVNALPTASASSNSPICAGTTLNLTGGGVGTYSWTSSNGFISTAQSPTISNATVSATGTYTITVTNVSGCTSTASAAVTVNATPIATASTNTPVICAGNNIALTGGGVGTYLWAGPNGYSSTAQSPTISNASISATGTYTIMVTNVNGCTSTATTSVTVNANPTATASSNSPICVGNTISLTGGGVGTYLWTGPNAYSSTAQSPTISNAIVSSSGTYTITVTNANNCTSTATVAVTVNANPSATASSNSPICAGNTLSLTGGGVGTYLWAGPNGYSSTAQSPTIANAAVSVSGIYTITVTNVSGCTSTATVSVTVNALPTATASSNSPICAGTTLNLTGGGVGTYAWTGPNSYISTAQSPTITSATILASGIYKITVTNVNGCTSTATTSVTVNPLPVVDAGANQTICEGSTASLTATCNLLTVSTTLSGASEVPANISTATGTVSGTFDKVTKQLLLTISFNGLAVNASAAHIHKAAVGVNGGVVIGFSGVPTATSGSFTYTGTLTTTQEADLLAGLYYVNVHNANFPGGEIRGQLSTACVANNFVWNPGNLSGQTVTVSPSAAQLYTVTASNTTTGCSSTATTTVNVNPRPVPTIGSNTPVCAGNTLNLTVSVGSSDSPSTFAWAGPNSFASTAQNPSIASAMVSASGTYTVTVTNVNGCINTATTAVVINALPTATASNNSPICSGVTLQLTGGGIGTYLWNGPSGYTSSQQSPSIPSATASMSGTYTILVTNVNGCTSTATTSVTVNPVVVIPTPQANTQIIFGASITLTVTGCSGVNDVLKWYQSADNALATMPVSPTATTNYYAKCETTLNGITCISGNSTDVTVTVLQPNPPVATGATNCVGTPTTLTATGCSGSVGTFVLKWYQNADDALVTMPVSPLVSTDYYAKCEQTFNSVTAVSAKSNVVTLTILNPPTPVSTGGTIYNGQSISLTATGCTGTLGTFTLKWYQTSDNALVTMPVSPTVTTQYYSKCEQTANSVTCLSAKSNDVTVTVVNRIFVDITKIAAPIQNGNSWATAYGNLQTGLAAATAGVEVWVSKGTYKPTNTVTRTIYFEIPNNVKVYGGFAGTEDNLIDRNFRTNVTILSGDIGTQNVNTDNSYHVVVMNGSSNITVLDGFTIMGGYANFDPKQNFNVPLTAPTTATIETGGGILVQNAGMPTIANCTIIQNSAVTGGGLYASDASMPTIMFCKFMANQAGFGSGLYFQDGSNGKVSNTLISGNRGIGGVYNNFSSPMFTNVTFAGNGGYNGGIFNSNSQPVVKNSIIWGNSTPFNDTQSIITYSTIQGGYAGVGNLSMDPKFVSLTPEGLSPILSGDYHVQASSLTIDRGDNGTISLSDKDLDGNLRRFAGGRVDMGAYEFQGTATATLVISVATGNWESNSTWDVGRVPQLGDYVIIESNHIVTLNGTGIAKNLEYRGTGQLKFNTATSKLEIGF